MKYYFVVYTVCWFTEHEHRFNNNYIQLNEDETFIVRSIEKKLKTDSRQTICIISKQEVTEAEYLANIQR